MFFLVCRLNVRSDAQIQHRRPMHVHAWLHGVNIHIQTSLHIVLDHMTARRFGKHLQRQL